MLAELIYRQPPPPESTLEPSCTWHGRSDPMVLTDDPTKSSRRLESLQYLCSIRLHINDPRVWDTPSNGAS
ncbi:hypothetical protein MRX96_024092 [Rhipicephalus microplus]